jgi:hypothetical protein
MNSIDFNEAELEHYSRHFLISGWGTKQQLVLKNAKLFLNVPNEIAARYLSAAGIGNLILSPDLAHLLPQLRELNPNICISLAEHFEQQLDNSFLALSCAGPQQSNCSRKILVSEDSSEFSLVYFENSLKLEKITVPKAPFSENLLMGIYLSLFAIKQLLSASNAL